MAQYLQFYLNETIGRISLAAFIPAAMEIARWIHLKHHAQPADIDPDNFMHHGHWFVLPFDGPILILYLKAFLKVQTNMCCVIKGLFGISYRLYRSYSA